MAATQIEVQSFIDKFSHLSSQGYIANLNFNCHLGKISVNFQAELGLMYGTPEPLTPFLTQRFLKPSQVRRRNKRCENRNTCRTTVENELPSNEITNSNNIEDQETIDDNDYTEDINDSAASHIIEDQANDVPAFSSNSSCVGYEQQAASFRSSRPNEVIFVAFICADLKNHHMTKGNAVCLHRC